MKKLHHVAVCCAAWASLILKVFLLQIWFIAEAPGCCQACSGGRHVSSPWGNCCPVSSTVQISEQSCGFCLGGSPLVTSPMAWRTKSWTQAGSLICKWVCLRNTHWEKVNLFLYKAEYLCTVNKYITNLSCLKKVLPFWCLFPKLIYKNVLCLLVFLLSSMHIIAFGLKIQLWKKKTTEHISALWSLTTNFTATHTQTLARRQLRRLVLGVKVGPDQEYSLLNCLSLGIFEVSLSSHVHKIYSYWF